MPNYRVTRGALSLVLPCHICALWNSIHTQYRTSFPDHAKQKYRTVNHSNRAPTNAFSMPGIQYRMPTLSVFTLFCAETVS